MNYWEEIKMSIVDHNVETGEVIERELTTQEKAQMKTDAAEFAAREAARQAKETATQSAVAKLQAIGLTAEEIAALRG